MIHPDLPFQVGLQEDRELLHMLHSRAIDHEAFLFLDLLLQEIHDVIVMGQVAAAQDQVLASRHVCHLHGVIHAEHTADIQFGLFIHGRAECSHHLRGVLAKVIANLAIVRAEVIPVLGQAVSFVHRDQIRRNCFHGLLKPWISQSLRCDEQKPQFAGHPVSGHLHILTLGLQAGKASRFRDTFSPKALHLVTHQGHQRHEDQRPPLQRERWDCKTSRIVDHREVSQQKQGVLPFDFKSVILAAPSRHYFDAVQQCIFAACDLRTYPAWNTARHLRQIPAHVHPVICPGKSTLTGFRALFRCCAETQRSTEENHVICQPLALLNPVESAVVQIPIGIQQTRQQLQTLFP